MLKTTILAVVLLAGCRTTSGAGPAPVNRLTQSKAAQTFPLLKRAEGKFAGTKLLWFKDPDNPEQSAATAEVTGNDIRYTWSFRGNPQSGTLAFARSGDQVEAELTDSWQSPSPMHNTGTQTDDAITVGGSYSVKSGPDWHWRTEVRMPHENQLLIEMYNIQPDGLERIAVRLRANRHP